MFLLVINSSLYRLLPFHPFMLLFQGHVACWNFTLAGPHKQICSLHKLKNAFALKCYP